MGAVYSGHHIKMNRTTAIKILSADLANSQEYVARFEREAEMASRIDHPNAVAIYDFGEAEDGLVYIAMEFIEGEPLSKVIEREGPLPVERVVRIVRQAAEAIDAAHRLGIIHRDFKPDNVMISQKPGRPDWVDVVDFGIAKRSAVEPGHQALTHTGFVLGTPQYMSPEQVAGEHLDGRSDLYSLALVAYEMLTRALPFAGNTPQSQMIKRLLEPPMPLRQALPQLMLPPAVDAVMLKALSRYPDQRQSTAIEFAQELETAARNLSYNQPYQQPVQPQPGPPPGWAQTPPPISQQTPRPSPPQNTPPPQVPGSGAYPSGPYVQTPPGQQAQRPHTPPAPMPQQPQYPNTPPTPMPQQQRPNTPYAPMPQQTPPGQFTPHAPTPSTPRPFQPHQPTPPQQPMPYPPSGPYPGPPGHMPMPGQQKSKAGIIVLIIVVLMLLFMGACFLDILLSS
jgi:serine/threonine-protein kinase